MDIDRNFIRVLSASVHKMLDALDKEEQDEMLFSISNSA